MSLRHCPPRRDVLTRRSEPDQGAGAQPLDGPHRHLLVSDASYVALVALSALSICSEPRLLSARWTGAHRCVESLKSMSTTCGCRSFQARDVAANARGVDALRLGAPGGLTGLYARVVGESCWSVSWAARLGILDESCTHEVDG
jgi:hypothetical protein